MPSERPNLPPPRERTFAELFPWRNIRRAVMLVLLIVAIVVLKRSTGGFLARVGDIWAPPRASPGLAEPSPVRGDVTTVRQIRLGPGLAPKPATPTSAVTEGR